MAQNENLIYGIYYMINKFYHDKLNIMAVFHVHFKDNHILYIYAFFISNTNHMTLELHPN